MMRQKVGGSRTPVAQHELLFPLGERVLVALIGGCTTLKGINLINGVCMRRQVGGSKNGFGRPPFLTIGYGCASPISRMHDGSAPQVRQGESGSAITTVSVAQQGIKGLIVVDWK